MITSLLWLKLWNGCCHVHDRFSAAKLRELKATYPDAKILVHPEDNWNPTVNVGGNNLRNLVASEESSYGDVDGVMDGNLDGFINAFLSGDTIEK